MVRQHADPKEGLGELVSLWTAASADALHRVLVLHPHVRESADAFEPLALLSKHHDTEPGTSAETAVLLLTDRRWRGGLGQLVRRIAGSGVLADDELDLLASVFLAADRSVYWQVPDEWFSDESVVVVVTGDTEGDPHEADEGQGPTVAARDVSPPLRRWAAAHLLAREPASWPQLLARATDLDARHGAAVVAGLLDSIESVPAAAQAFLVSKGTTWPHQSVRRAALEIVATRDGAQAAYRLANVDSNAKIRAWAETLVRPASVAQGLDFGQHHRGRERSASDCDQATLF